jgi:C-terminal processing protease CtpA/Prc
VVDASRASDRVLPGDVLTEIDGQPAARWFEKHLALISGSPQHKRWRAARELTTGPKGSTVTLRLARGGQSQVVSLAYHAAQPLQGARPVPMSEVRPGIHYVDLSRFDRMAFEKALDTLQDGKGIIFDLRGYPSADAVHVVKHWVTGVDKAQWMFVPRYDKPYAEATTAWSIGWQVDRVAKLERAAKVLLLDGRAISYAESLAAYFPAQKVGTVIGEPSAGANGNVARAMLPSGMSFFFTSMRVTRHDGTTTLHREGVVPDIAVSPSVEGLRAGRDELLERAISVIEKPASR